ncbi:MAG: esterase-like activity of phytase family protein [Pseudomonadota bacterium]
MRAKWRQLACALFVTVLPINHAAANGGQPLEIRAKPITSFLIGSDQQQFGPLTFVGGLEMTSREPHFGAISATTMRDNTIWLITDTGYWINGILQRDRDGRAQDINNATFGEIKAAGGARFSNKWEVDAEGVALTANGTVLISFERDHRIAEYAWANGDLTFVRQETPPVPLYELRQNRGFEALAIAPSGFAYPDAVVGVSEKSLDRDANIMGFINPPGPSNAFEFSVRRTDNFDVTDAAFLPGGDLILLERRFNLAQGIAMRLRRIASDALAPGATVDGPTLLQADMAYQIDNMEGLSIAPISEGRVRLTLVSDDNKSLLQRNLLLEFEMALN